jgi:cobalt-zinc-cadmium efflux system membrane fusion protein
MTSRSFAVCAGCLAAFISLAGCKSGFNPADGASPSPQVVEEGNEGLVSVESPDQFPLVATEKVETAAQLNVTGSVFPDVSREIPVISLANGRVVDIKARLDDHVEKGDLLLRVQSLDVSGAFDTYLKAANDEQLANKAYQRAHNLYDHGAISQSMLEQAEDSEKDARADLTAAEEQLKTLGIDKDHPSSVVNVYAPISGVIVTQNVTQAAAAGVNLSGSATTFTIADLSRVWIICDVYENDIPKIQLGQTAQIRTAAYPGKVLTGRVSDIGPVLDPSIRTAKVRIEIANPGILRLGMFVNATFTSSKKDTFAAIPSSAILHLHDRDWVFVPADGNKFRRVEVGTGDSLPGNKQQILSGIAPGQRIVRDVLNFEATLEAQ